MSLISQREKKILLGNFLRNPYDDDNILPLLNVFQLKLDSPCTIPDKDFYNILLDVLQQSHEFIIHIIHNQEPSLPRRQQRQQQKTKVLLHCIFHMLAMFSHETNIGKLIDAIRYVFGTKDSTDRKYRKNAHKFLREIYEHNFRNLVKTEEGRQLLHDIYGQPLLPNPRLYQLLHRRTFKTPTL